VAFEPEAGASIPAPAKPQPSTDERGRERHADAGKGAGRPPGARLCAAEKRSRAGPRAQRASFI